MIHDNDKPQDRYFCASGYPQTQFPVLVGKADTPQSFIRQFGNVARPDTVRELLPNERYSLAGCPDVGLLPGVTAQNGVIV